jgi:hypothetical protein
MVPLERHLLPKCRGLIRKDRVEKMPEVDPSIEAARNEELQADAQAEIKELSTQRTLERLQTPLEPAIPPEYVATLVGISSDLLATFLAWIRLFKLGQVVSPQIAQHSLLISNVLATQLLAWTEGRWQTGLGMVQVGTAITKAVSVQLVELKLKEREEQAKLPPKPAVQAPPVQVNPAASVTIPFPPPKPPGT